LAKFHSRNCATTPAAARRLVYIASGDLHRMRREHQDSSQFLLMTPPDEALARPSKVDMLDSKWTAGRAT
jgi:hypothetical protein